MLEQFSPNLLNKKRGEALGDAHDLRCKTIQNRGRRRLSDHCLCAPSGKDYVMLTATGVGHIIAHYTGIVPEQKFRSKHACIIIQGGKFSSQLLEQILITEMQLREK